VSWKHVARLLSRQLLAVTIGACAAIVILTPLGLALYQTPNIGKVLLNLPANGWPQLLPTLRHIATVPFHIFIYGQNAPVFALGHVPMLTVFETTMFTFGAYVYLHHVGLYRFRVL